MPTTTVIDTTFSAAALQDRTDGSGSTVTDVNGEELRLFAQLLSEGVLTADAFDVAPGAGLSVDVGSGSAKADVAVVAGVNAGQGNYLVRLDVGTINVPVTTADLSNPRIDEVYLIVADNSYDAGSRTLPRIGYRKGDAAGSPSAPGPDSSWDAYLLLATLAVGAGAGSLSGGDITDERVLASIIPGGDHTHVEADLPDASTSAQGVVQLSNSYVGTSQTKAATEKALTDGLADHDHDAADVASGTLSTSRIPNLDAGKITSGTLADARIPSLNASKITAGTFAIARIPTGTSSSTAALGNHSHSSFASKPDFNAGLDIPGSGTLNMYWPGVQRINDSAWGSLRLEGDNNYRLYFHTSTKYQKSDELEIDIARSLRTIEKLVPLTYRSKGTKRRQIGFFAENVAEAEPLTAPLPRDTENGKGEVPSYSSDGLIAHVVNVLKYFNSLDIEDRLKALEA